MRVSLFNRKGGSGKTTTATNLAAALAKLGQRVLLIDMDSQANATLSLKAGALSETCNIGRVLNNTQDINDAIVRVHTFDMITSYPDEVASAESYLTNKHIYDSLKYSLSLLSSPYDFVLIDCPPSDSYLTYNALVASDCVIVPVQMQFLAVKAVDQVKDIIKMLKDNGHMDKSVEISAVIPNMYGGQAEIGRYLYEKLTDEFGGKITNPIPFSQKFSESQTMGKPLVEYKTWGSAARSARKVYMDLAKELIKEAK